MAPWLLVVVDGPSEVRLGEDPDVARGVVTKILAQHFGEECANGVSIRYWHQVTRSPLRDRENPRSKVPERVRKHGRHAEKAYQLARLGTNTAYGTVILLDSDNHPERLAALQEGVEASGEAARTAYGLAREMVEAWLLADPSLLAKPLPRGKRCEDLWGLKRDPKSNYPKHVLRHCVLEPKGWTFPEAVEQWDPMRARPNSPSLHAFISQIETLAHTHYVL
jgi:hypothetical protein